MHVAIRLCILIFGLGLTLATFPRASSRLRRHRAALAAVTPALLAGDLGGWFGTGRRLSNGYTIVRLNGAIFFM